MTVDTVINRLWFTTTFIKSMLYRISFYLWTWHYLLLCNPERSPFNHIFHTTGILRRLHQGRIIIFPLPPLMHTLRWWCDIIQLYHISAEALIDECQVTQKFSVGRELYEKVSSRNPELWSCQRNKKGYETGIFLIVIPKYPVNMCYYSKPNSKKFPVPYHI